MFGPSPVPLGFSAASSLTCGKMVFQQLRYVKLLILLTCENITGTAESSLWLALVTLRHSPRSKGGN